MGLVFSHILTFALGCAVVSYSDRYKLQHVYASVSVHEKASLIVALAISTAFYLLQCWGAARLSEYIIESESVDPSFGDQEQDEH